MRTIDRLTDIVGNADYLFLMHPAPWKIESNSLDGYVVDAKGNHIFGGEVCEGYVSENNVTIQALVDLVNSVWAFMRG